MATTATTTGRFPRAADDVFELLRRLVPLLPAWSYEGTLRDMVALFTAPATGMLVAAALVRARA